MEPAFRTGTVVSLFWFCLLGVTALLQIGATFILCILKFVSECTVHVIYVTVKTWRCSIKLWQCSKRRRDTALFGTTRRSGIEDHYDIPLELGQPECPVRLGHTLQLRRSTSNWNPSVIMTLMLYGWLPAKRRLFSQLLSSFGFCPNLKSRRLLDSKTCLAVVKSGCLIAFTICWGAY